MSSPPFQSTAASFWTASAKATWKWAGTIWRTANVRGILVAKTLKWRVLGGTKDVDLWFVGPDCGRCGVGGTQVGGGNEQEFGLRGSADDERDKDDEGQGRAHINSMGFKRA